MHLAALDIGWFINFVLTNPFWVMAFASAAYFLSDKRPIFGGTLLALYVHSTVDAATVLGWVFTAGGLFFVAIMVFFGLVLFDTFLGNTKYSVKRTLATTIVFYASMVVINVFLV